MSETHRVFDIFAADLTRLFGEYPEISANNSGCRDALYRNRAGCQKKLMQVRSVPPLPFPSVRVSVLTLRHARCYPKNEIFRILIQAGFSIALTSSENRGFCALTAEAQNTLPNQTGG